MQLEIHQLCKRYKNNFWALREIDLQLKPGIVGLVGPNGAGKSTLMRILATISQPTTGTVTWNGANIAKILMNCAAHLDIYLKISFGTV